ncbi:Transcriptional regulator, TetR family [Streptococcus sp. DD10]|nr:Transcriptional regulator, TetR family [Streptococcus sp. DD10]
MVERKMSPNSLENLKKSNQEANAITRESLEISLLQLLERKSLSKITISELVHRAGVSRSAFYRNYSSKEEILETIFKRSIQRMLAPLSQYSKKADLYLIWLSLFKAAKKEAYVISLAVDYGMEKLLEQAIFDFLEKRNEAKQKKWELI